MTTTTTAEQNHWTGSQKIAFRFFFLFFSLYILFNPIRVIPFMQGLYFLYVQPLHIFIAWMAKHVLHTARPITNFANGSGDSTYNYLIILFIISVSAIGTIIWSITGKNTPHYNKLLYWLTVVIRYYVAITMFTYGSAKVIKLQFPAPSLGRLIEPVGNMSPMGLAWTYMGYSTGYNYFTGFVELTCGILLFFRKTTTLGAIIGLVVAGNIMAIDYCFDVPAKLLSTFLVLMCIFLLFKDAKRLIKFFFKNQDAQPSNLSPHRFKAKWKNITLTFVKYVLAIYVVAGDLVNAVQANEQHGDSVKRPVLYGIYNVESFVRNKDILAPLTTDTFRWSKLIISGNGGIQVKFMNDSMKFYSIKTDTVKHEIVVNTPEDKLCVYSFIYNLQKTGELTLSGKWKQDSVHIRLSKYDIRKFPLLNRGFHWINELPVNK